MEYSIKRQKSIVVFELTGEIKGSDSKFLLKMLEEADLKDAKMVAYNCENIEFIDSSGLGGFMSVKNKADELGLKMAFYCLTDDLKDLFEMTSFGKFFSIFKNEQEMLESTQMFGAN